MIPLLAGVPSCLFRPEDEEDLARVVLGQLEHPIPANVSIEDWSQLISRMDRALLAVCEKIPAQRT
jgi:hypothetical protein